MAGKNPFFSIEPRKEHIFGIDLKKLKDYAKRLAKGGTLVIISGEHGAGKSAVSMKLESELPKSIKKIKLLCSLNLKKELKSLKAKKKTVVFIEKFFICLSLKENDIRTIVNDVADMIHSGLSFVITAPPPLAASIPYMSNRLNNVLVFDIPPLSLGDTKKMVSLRLNEVRRKKSDKIEPFTENEILQVWRNANGNPKMILLLCASLYDAKGSS